VRPLSEASQTLFSSESGPHQAVEYAVDEVADLILEYQAEEDRDADQYAYLNQFHAFFAVFHFKPPVLNK
jgi:hypothetical protein